MRALFVLVFLSACSTAPVGLAVAPDGALYRMRQGFAGSETLYRCERTSARGYVCVELRMRDVQRLPSEGGSR